MKTFDHYLRETISLIRGLTIIFLIRTFIFGLYTVPTGSMETTLLVGESLVSDKLTVWFKPIQRGEVIAFNQPSTTYDYSDNSFINILQNYFGMFWGPDNWTKRVIGIPGDRIQGKIEDGKAVVYRNGEKLDEPYVNKYPLALEARKVYSDTGRGFGYQYHQFSYDPAQSANDQPFYRLAPDAQLLPELRYPATPLPGNKDIYDVKLKENEYWVMGDNREGSSDSRYFGILEGKLIHGRVIFRFFSYYDPAEGPGGWMIISLIKNPVAFFRNIRWNRLFQVIS